MDKRKQRGDQNVLARKSNKNQIKNATNVDEERWMKKKLKRVIGNQQGVWNQWSEGSD